MKRIIMVIAIMGALLVAVSSIAKKKNPCILTGTINGEQIRTVRCRIELAGNVPYILASINVGGTYYLADMSGLTAQTGKQKFRLKLVELDGDKWKGVYRSTGTLTVNQHKANPDVRYVSALFDAKERNGATLKVKGTFGWMASALPAGPKEGKLSVKFGEIQISNKSAKLERWSDKYRVNKLVLIRNGETANVSLLVPSLKEGKYGGKEVTLTVIHSKMEGEKLSLDMLKSSQLVVTVTKENDKTKITYKGFLKGKKGTVPVEGSFFE